jgi:ATP-dependent exoDNAse (exonuclease V) beta subunit
MSTVNRRFPNVVIRASAGTGKTFQLSNRFIGLAAAGEPLDTILATTFTRKAAGEILDRVLTRLAEAALDSKKLAELTKHVGDSSLDRARCLDILHNLLRQLHRIRVGTLDHFFIQIARSFSLDLGLPPGWRIVDEVVDHRLRAEAIRRVLEDKPTQDTVRLMHLLTKGEASRSVSRQIASRSAGRSLPWSTNCTAITWKPRPAPGSRCRVASS